MLDAASELDEAKTILKGKRADWELAVRDLQAEIRGDNERPLLDVAEGRRPAATPAGPAASTNGHAGVDESWRTVTLESIGWPNKILAQLRDAGLTTVGDLADYTGGKTFGKYLSPCPGGRRLTDIDGVGHATAEKIENLAEKFWADWKAAPVTASTEAEANGKEAEPQLQSE